MSKNFIELLEGDKLYYQSYGNGKNIILLFHGLVGGSWLGGEWISAIERNNVRCIVPERPGYGNSSSIELNSVSDWIPIVQKLVEKLNIESMDVIGCSAGAPYAYATALALPEAVKKVYILGGVPAVYEDKVLRHYSEESRKAYKGFASQPQSVIQEYYIPQMEAAKERLTHTDLTYVKNILEEVLDQRCFGMAQESRLQILPWNLPLAEIKQSVVFYHAQSDEMVPYDGEQEMPGFFKNHEFHDVDRSSLPQGESPHISSISWSFCSIMNSYDEKNKQ